MAIRRDKVLAAAEKYAAKGQHDKAAKEYQAIVDDDPQDIRSWLLLADCLVRSGQRDKAIERYLQVGKFYTQAKAPQKALAVYRQVLNLDGGRLDVHLRCAHLFRELGQIPDAVLIFEKVAAAYHKDGRDNEAIELFGIVAEMEPRNVAKRLRLAEFYSAQNMIDPAVENFGRCADLLREEGRVQEYIRVAERLLYHKPVDEVLRGLASVYLQLNEPRRALMKLNTLLQRSPSDPANLELFAETFVALGKTDKAVSVMLELAKGERDKGPQSKSNAIRVLKKALVWDPGNASVEAALANLGGAPEEEEEAEIEELDAEEIEELEAEDVEDFEELEEQDTGEREPGIPHLVELSLTKEVMSEVTRDDVELEQEGDIDKVLHEVRVLLKYRLFEHALSYLEGAFELDAHHVAALELKAELLGELGRPAEAADAHAEVATLVRSRDPAKAELHARLALEAAPGHAHASELANGFGTVEAEVTDIDLDTGEFDLGVGESEAEPVGFPNTIEPEVDTGVLAEAFEPIELPDDESEDLLLAADDSGAGIPQEAHVDESGLILEEPEFAELEGVAEDEDEFEFDHSSPETTHGRRDLRLVNSGSGGQAAVSRPAGPDESAEFAISVDAEPEDLDEPGPVAIEDRFGLEGDAEPLVADDAAAVPRPIGATETVEWPDISDELEEVEFFLGRGLEEDARFALEDLQERHPDHPAVLALQARLSGDADESVAVSSRDDPSAGEGLASAEELESPTPSGAAAPLLDFEDEDDTDDYLTAMFDEAPKAEKSVQHHARAKVEDADAGTHFDLGTAYREMGLIDDALAEFGAAAVDPRWQAKALVMMASLQLHRGETDRAIASLEGAVAAARTADEKSEAYYELGLIYETVGEHDKAVEQFENVADGFRDKAEKLEALRA